MSPVVRTRKEIARLSFYDRRLESFSGVGLHSGAVWRFFLVFYFFFLSFLLVRHTGEIARRK